MPPTESAAARRKAGWPRRARRRSTGAVAEAHRRENAAHRLATHRTAYMTHISLPHTKKSTSTSKKSMKHTTIAICFAFFHHSALRRSPDCF